MQFKPVTIFYSSIFLAPQHELRCSLSAVNIGYRQPPRGEVPTPGLKEQQCCRMTLKSTFWYTGFQVRLLTQWDCSQSRVNSSYSNTVNTRGQYWGHQSCMLVFSPFSKNLLIEVRPSVKAKWANVIYAKVVRRTIITLAYCTAILLGFKSTIHISF